MSVQFLEGHVQQRPGERIAYSVDTTPYGGNPGAPAAYVYDVSDDPDGAGVDVSATRLAAGGASADGAVITTPLVENVAGGETLRLVVRFACGGNTYAPFVYIHGIH